MRPVSPAASERPSASTCPQRGLRDSAVSGSRDSAATPSLADVARCIPSSALLSHDDALLFGVDADMLIDFVNEHSATALLMSVGSDLAYLRANLRNEASADAVQSMVRTALQGGRQGGRLMRVALASGETRSYLIDVYARVDEAGRATGALVCGRCLDIVQGYVVASDAPTASDAIDSGMTNRRTGSARQMLQRASSLLLKENPSAEEQSFHRRLLRSIADGVQAPLLGVLASLKLLEGELFDTLSQPHNDMLNEIKQACKEPLLVLQNVLLYERLHWTPTAAVAKTLLLPLLDDVLLYHLYATRVMSLKVSVRKTFWKLRVGSRGPQVLADPLLLAHALHNLVSNAIKHSPSGGTITVLVTSHCATGDSASASATAGTVQIEVVDEGPGMSGGLSEVGPAVGEGKLAMGLLCSKMALEAMRGTLSIGAAKEGSGACVSIEVPLVEEEAGPDTAETVEQSLMRLRYLVVDDSAPSRKMICRLIAKQCDKVVEAKNGLEGVNAVKASLKEGGEALDVVLVDAFMPVVDGLDATAMMRELGFKGLIVGVTGSSLKDDVDAFMSYGADYVLPKPLDLTKLNQFIVSRL